MLIYEILANLSFYTVLYDLIVASFQKNLMCLMTSFSPSFLQADLVPGVSCFWIGVVCTWRSLHSSLPTVWQDWHWNHILRWVQMCFLHLFRTRFEFSSQDCDEYKDNINVVLYKMFSAIIFLQQIFCRVNDLHLIYPWCFCAASTEQFIGFPAVHFGERVS